MRTFFASFAGAKAMYTAQAATAKHIPPWRCEIGVSGFGQFMKR
jgi:hypothetical protein